MRLSPLATLFVSSAVVLLSGCVSLERLESPEAAFSGYPTQAKPLQIPADLAPVNSTGQFVLPSVKATAPDAAAKKQ